jgi:hypothetical protein
MSSKRQRKSVRQEDEPEIMLSGKTGIYGPTGGADGSNPKGGVIVDNGRSRSRWQSVQTNAAVRREDSMDLYYAPQFWEWK